MGWSAVTGLVEIKCPNTATHLEILLTGKIDVAVHRSDAIPDGLHRPQVV